MAGFDAPTSLPIYDCPVKTDGALGKYVIQQATCKNTYQDTIFKMII